MPPRREAALVTHFKRLIVTRIEGAWSGSGPYDVEGFTVEKPYEVLATLIKVFEDGSSVPTFLLESDGGGLREVVCEYFRVVEKEEPDG